ncbi:MAG TPA: phosphatase PAP2 family protein [Thermomicrobiales bacterium]|nr:phosphatase PAP2 family protein [Thermomicrobiales bacterium]
MEIFGRSPYIPTSPFEWLLLIGVLGAVVTTATLASDWPAAALMFFAAIASFLFDSALYIPLGIALAGASAWLFRGRTIHVHPGQRALREGLICSGVFTLYEMGRHATRGSAGDALRNSEAIIDFERHLRIDPEHAVQALLLQHRELLHFINSAYSWLFLPFVAGTLFWLYLTQDQLFRQYRTALAISALAAVVIIALHPVAPPRLTPGSDLIGTHALVGGSHSFVNQFAAMPSLHVGWVALSGVALFVGVKSWLRWFWLVGPASGMLFVVMSTGHHYLVDGIAGATISVGPLLAILWVDRRLGGPYYFSFSVLEPKRVLTYANAAAREVAEVPRLRFSVYSLGLMLTYLIVRQVVDPGFTHYWGYMVAQIALSLIVILILSVHYSAQGGFSLLTHVIIVVTTYADTLGTAGHMYDRYISYDKITHFLGSAAVASAVGDVLIAKARKGSISWSPRKMMIMAAGIAIGMGALWEVYEYVGDRLLDTGRDGGMTDTTYDLISDSAGAIFAAALLYWWQFTSPETLSPRQSVAVQRADDDSVSNR